MKYRIHETITIPTGNGFATEVEITDAFRAKCEVAGITVQQGAQEWVDRAAQRRLDKANVSTMSRHERQAYNNL